MKLIKVCSALTISEGTWPSIVGRLTCMNISVSIIEYFTSCATDLYEGL
jgi:hypothetical protein